MSINPATEEVLKQFNPLSDAELDKKILATHQAFGSWKKIPLEKKEELFFSLASILKQNKEEYAKIITLEMGKLESEAIAEVEKCALLCQYYQQNARNFLKEEIISTHFKKSWVAFQPLGVILGVMPWNFPFWQVFRFAVPAMMAGNTALLKHASNVPQISQLLEELFLKAGFPEHVFTHLMIPSSQVERILANDLVKAVSLTGSVEAGSKVAAIAGKYIKKSVLELGGSDAYVILKDADINMAVEKCATSRLLNAGQSCISAKRFIVEAPIYDQFLAGFQKYFEKINQLAPLATKDIRSHLHTQVETAIQGGAKCVMGGKLPSGKGFFYSPTILTQVHPGNAAFDEELFGPVASMIQAKDEQEAISLANLSHFGLGGAIFSQDLEKAQYLAQYEMESGSCFINDFVRSDPKFPFGGIKMSGYGRELSHYGILEFTNIKTICLN